MRHRGGHSTDPLPLNTSIQCYITRCGRVGVLKSGGEQEESDEARASGGKRMRVDASFAFAADSFGPQLFISDI